MLSFILFLSVHFFSSSFFAISVDRGATYPVRYTFDTFGNKTSMTTYRKETPSGIGDTTTWTYDEASGVFTSEQVNGLYSKTLIRHWDAFGRSVGYSVDGTRQATLYSDGATRRLSTMNASGAFQWEYLPGTHLKSRLTYSNAAMAEWAYKHPGIIAAGLNNPTSSDVRKNFSGDSPRNYGYIHCREITDEMECKLKCILEQNHKWRYTNNCASFASETFEEVTGVDIDADDWFGFETPREIGDSILQGNGGLPSNIGAIPYAPEHRNSSNSSKAK